MLTEQRFDCGALGYSSHQRGQRHRKVVGHGPARPQLGKFVLEVTMLNLMERHPSDVTQVVGADRPHRDAIRKTSRLPHYVPADDDLSAVGGTHDSRRLMDRQPDEAGSSFSDLADMKTHSDAHPPVEWPRFLFNPQLRLRGALERRSR